MKQKFLYLAMAAMTMASCSQDETIDVYKGKGIGFRAESPAGTRAAEVTSDNINDFWASAFLSADGKEFFPTTQFTKGEGGYFTSTPEYNWPGDENEELTFYAFSPSKESLSGDLTLNKTEQKLENFTVASTIAGQQDLIYATNTGTAAVNEGNGVHLKFEHMLSQIEVQAYVAREANEEEAAKVAYKFDVKGVKIGGIPSTANLTDFGTKTWTTPTGQVDYEDGCTQFVLDGTLKSIMNIENGNAMLIPQTLTKWDIANDPENNNRGAYIGVLVKITTKEGGVQIYPETEGEYGYACVPIDTEWKPGMHYIYKLDFSDGAGYVDPEDPVDPGKPILGGGIKFTVEVTPWVPEDKPIPME